MKLFIAALFLISFGAIASGSDGYVTLKASTINNSDLIKDLRQLGAEYVLEKGIFSSTKAPLYNGSWGISKTEKVERKTTSGVTYYRYTVQIQSKSAPTLIRAVYVVAFRNANGNTLVKSYSYRILSNNPDGPFLADLPMFFDLKSLTDGSGVDDYLNEGVDYVVKQAIAKGQIKKGKYRVGTTFSIQDTGFSFPYGYNFLTTIVNKSTGYTYRVRIFVFITENLPENQQDDFPPTYTIYPNK